MSIKYRKYVPHPLGLIGGQKESQSSCRSACDQEDLIHMNDGLIVPVTRSSGVRTAPPSYHDSVMSQQRQFQETFSHTRGFTPQYSYTNR